MLGSVARTLLPSSPTSTAVEGEGTGRFPGAPLVMDEQRAPSRIDIADDPATLARSAE
jgi:hypothetical protein